MESKFWKFIKLRILGRIRRLKNAQRDSGRFLDRLCWDIAESDLFIDAGANIGTISKVVLDSTNFSTVPIMAFEPDPEAFLILSKISNQRLTKVNQAVWVSEGLTSLYRHKDWEVNRSHTSSTLVESKSNTDDKNSVLVSTIDFANLLENSSASKITIKMDIEGAEYRVLNHLLRRKTLRKVHRLYCEFHPNSIRFGYTLHLLLGAWIFLSGNRKKIRVWL
jgi:FkbM family methyltransferase